jgi:hypothetical protein
VGRPSATWVIIPFYHALKRGAKLARPSRGWIWAATRSTMVNLKLVFNTDTSVPIQAREGKRGHVVVLRNLAHEILHLLQDVFGKILG